MTAPPDTPSPTAGCFVAVVGPSGSGKDTLIAAARDRLRGDSRFVFVRRVVTRAAGGNEDHDTVDPATFAAAARAGAYALHWGAHGLFYGIPAGVAGDVAAGRVVVANLSRAALDAARRLFPRTAVLAVTAPVEILADRLAARGRETRADILERLSTARDRIAGPDVTEIDNGGDLDTAVAAFVRRLVDVAEPQPQGRTGRQ